MSAVKDFMTKLQSDTDLQQKLKAAQDSYKGDLNDKDKAAESIVIPVAKAA